MARSLSVNAGHPREIAWRGKIVYTSVWKEVVDGRLTLPLPGQFVVLRLRPKPGAPPILRSYSLSDLPRVDLPLAPPGRPGNRHLNQKVANDQCAVEPEPT